MVKVRYVCNQCGYESGKWYGKCPTCNNWNTFEEEIVESKRKGFRFSISVDIKAQKISEIKTSSMDRFTTGFEEFDRVLGGGIVPGSVVLLSGDPGIGKSTLLLQIAVNVSGKGKKVYYITGEESKEQVKMRSERLCKVIELNKKELYIISATDVDRIVEILNHDKPSLVIIDSIQTMESSQFSGFPGSLPQIRNATSSLISYAKTSGVPVFLVGHVTKEGIVAGPMLLSHMVDSVIYLEGEKFSEIRILRAFKNRFGDATEVGIFVMQENGLSEIKDVSSFFVNKKDGKVPGTCATVIMEGSRPMLVEIQALVVSSTLSFPRRVISGLNEKRVELLLAVIQKHVKVPLERMDVFVNVVGGIKILEPASDLAITLAVISSFKNMSLNSSVAISEVGLLGELRNVTSLEKRASEARKLGFKNILTSKEYKSLNDIIRRI